MRTTVEVKWFKECVTMEQVVALYKTLCKQHHPDLGGNVRTMQEINVEYDAIKRNPSLLGQPSKRSGRTYDNSWRPRDYSRGARYQQKTYTYSAKDNSFVMEPGLYECEITEVRENDEKGYVALVFDVSEGMLKGHFKYSPWYKHTIYLFYRGADWKICKSRNFIDRICKCNPGFDGHGAFCDDEAHRFVGKRLRIWLSQKYIDGNGFINPEDVSAI